MVATASDAMAAISEARRHRPVLVVLDVLMPGISGLEVVDKIIDASPETKVVLLTSSESEEDLLTAIKAGAVGLHRQGHLVPQAGGGHARCR